MHVLHNTDTRAGTYTHEMCCTTLKHAQGLTSMSRALTDPRLLQDVVGEEGASVPLNGTLQTVDELVRRCVSQCRYVACRHEQ